MPCEDKVKLTVVELGLKSLTFTTDHDLLRNNLIDYEPTGELFPEPKWQAGRTPYEDFPISHTVGQNVGIDATIELLPPGSDPPEFALSTQGPPGFHFSQAVSLPGGETVVSLTSTDQLEQRIQRIQRIQDPVEWTIRHNGRTFLRKTAGPYQTFVTMGRPRDTDVPQHVVTWNRMMRAVEQAGAANSLNPHEVVRVVIQSQGDFDLGAPQSNAWVVPDTGGDCQSIVRFVA